MGRESRGPAAVAAVLVALAPLVGGVDPASAATSADQGAFNLPGRTATDSGRLAEPARAPDNSTAEDPIVAIRPEALITTATVLALAMGVTGVATAVRARRRAGD